MTDSRDLTKHHLEIVCKLINENEKLKLRIEF